MPASTTKIFHLTLMSLLIISVEGKCHYLLQSREQVVAHCDVASSADYASISSLDPQTNGLILNISGMFNDSLVSFEHLHHLKTLKFEPSTRYSSYQMAGLENAKTLFTRVTIFENLKHLKELRINIVLIGFNWEALTSLPELRILDVSYTQMHRDDWKRLLEAIRTYKTPLESISMISMQRIDMQFEIQPIGTGKDIYPYLQNSSLKVLDLLGNQEVRVQPGLSIYLPQLEVLRIGGDRLLSFKEDFDSLSGFCVIVDLLLHPAIREFTLHFPRQHVYSSRRKRWLFDHFFKNSDKALKAIQHCDVQNTSSSNFVCSIVNCLCDNFVTFPCKMFQGIQLHDILVPDRDCFASIQFPVPPFLQQVVVTRGVLITPDRLGPICIDPNNKVTYMDLANNGLKGSILEDFGIKGLQKIKYLNLQENGMMITVKMSLVEDMPSLEVLLLGRNAINITVPDKIDFLQSSSLQSLDMQECNLGNIPASSFCRLESLQYLNVSGNGLTDFDVNLTASHHLRHLNLSNNLLRNINVDLRAYLDTLAETNNVTLDLSQNPLECSCQDLSLLRWLKGTKVLLARLNLTTCTHPMQGETRIRDVDIGHFYRMCIHFDVIISSIGSSFGVALVIGVGFLIYKRRWRFRYWMHVANEAMRRRYATNPYHNTLANDFVYDAFVAYSSHGEERPWVHTTLREKLEGEHGLKLCMYHRDFKVGRDLADTIVEGINSSNKVLLILSPTFLNSCWCEFEVRMANEKVVKERRDAVILVVYSRLDQAGVRLPRKLARLLEKRIYIEWTEDPDGQKLFWSRLVHTLKVNERYDAFGELSEISDTQARP